MTPERWREVDDLFQRAADLTPEERTAWLDEACDGDNELQREVESLLEHDTRDTRIARTVRQESAAVLGACGDLERAGPYRLTDVIGRGGMGVVYRAVRDDDVYKKQVAVKLVKRGMDTDFVLARFRSERQILAQLEHPNIARLLDGGSTADGRPYFVMEYVEGTPITDYCESRRLPLASRLKLFLAVCAAVQNAHQQLVVHRDLKPTNILVSTDGSVKLLDFGIARVLAPDAAGSVAHTAAAIQMLTPTYASPEQIQGGQVSTASDVYSLGVVLHEVLTGHSTAASPERALPSDLGKIVQMALRKEPERRYATVDQFADDILRYLENRPIQARPDTVRYRARKFLRRNRLLVTAAVLLTVSLIGGTMVSVWQARRAERRFDQLHKLANALIYDVHDEIQELSGSTRARQKIVATALEYLDALRREAGGDTRLQLDMAAAYSRIGDVQGGAMNSNLGDRKSALESYNKARTILSALAVDVEVSTRLADLEVRIADLMRYTTGSAAAIEILRKAAARLEQTMSALGATPRSRSQLGTIYWREAQVLADMRDYSGSEENGRKAVAVYEALVAEYPDDRLYHNEFSSAETVLGRALNGRGKSREALPHARRGVELAEALAAAAPGNIGLRRDLMSSYSQLADILNRSNSSSIGDSAGAIRVYRTIRDLAGQMAAADVSDQRAAFEYAVALERLGSALLETPARAEGLAHLRASIERLRAVAGAEPSNRRTQAFLSLCLKRLGDGLAAQGTNVPAVASYREAIRIGEGIIGVDSAVPGIVSGAEAGAGIALAKLGRPREAREAGDRAVGLCETTRRSQPNNIRAAVECAAARAALGRIQLMAGDRASGCAELAKSIEQYEDVRDSSAYSQWHRSDLKRAVAEAARCEMKSARR